ncbi:MAG: hypothetical protein ABI564_14505, partial [Ideonella sp.]
MNVEQARQVVLVRAVESDARPAATPDAATSPASIWSAADSEWADDAALRQLGESATAELFLIERARLATDRLAERDPTMAMLNSAGSRHGNSSLAVGLLLVFALISGLATDALGPSRQVNLLAPPLLALMLWNLVVYLVLLVNAARRR